MKWLKALPVFLSLVVILFAGCKPQGFEYRDIRNFSISNLDFNKSVVKLELVYFNPNNFGVTLKKVEADVYLNKNYVGKYILDTTLFIPKKSEFSLASSMQVDMRNLLKNSISTLLGGEVLLEVTGTSRVGKSGFYINVPIQYSGRHNLSLF